MAKEVVIYLNGRDAAVRVTGDSVGTEVVHLTPMTTVAVLRVKAGNDIVAEFKSNSVDGWRISED
jgi:hypothetical protein